MDYVGFRVRGCVGLRLGLLGLKLGVVLELGAVLG